MLLKNRIFLLLILIIFSISTSASARDTITFRCQEDIIPNVGRTIGADSSSITINTVKFYVQHLRLIRNHEIVWTAPSTYLVDLSDVNSEDISMDTEIKEGDSLCFILGIDSMTCVGGVNGGELDPARAMYWTWQSGYINMKIEGNSPLSNARNHELQFHIGGYKYPYATAREVRLVVPEKSTREVVFSLNNLFNGIDLSTVDHIMSPGEKASTIASKAAAAFLMN